jgi:hypothetical protein
MDQTMLSVANKDKRGFDLLSDALPFGRLGYGFTGSR